MKVSFKWGALWSFLFLLLKFFFFFLLILKKKEKEKIKERKREGNAHSPPVLLEFSLSLDFSSTHLLSVSSPPTTHEPPLTDLSSPLLQPTVEQGASLRHCSPQTISSPPTTQLTDADPPPTHSTHRLTCRRHCDRNPNSSIPPDSRVFLSSLINYYCPSSGVRLTCCHINLAVESVSLCQFASRTNRVVQHHPTPIELCATTIFVKSWNFGWKFG